MNLDEYRAMKEAEKAQAETPKVEQTPATPQPEPVAQVQTQEPPATPTPAEATPQVTPEKIVIDGQELTVEQIREGFMRTQDYTRKTQEAARIRKEAEQALQVVNQLRQRPEQLEQLGVRLPSEADQERMRLEDDLVAREIELNSLKYNDFDPREALEIASKRPGMSLEDAYLLSKARKPSTSKAEEKPQIDIEEIKKQIRADLLKELESSQTATQSIISSNDSVAPTKPADDIQLTEAELEYCKKSRTPVEQYKKDKMLLLRQRQ